MKVFAVIPSGGLGKRVNSPLPKQYIKFNDKEIIAYTIEVFQKSNLIDGIVIAAQKEFYDLIKEIKEKYSFTKIINIVEGGKERQNSVYNALISLPYDNDSLIAVHDAVRPLLSQKILTDAIETAKINGCAVVASKAKDTLITGNEFVQSYIDREEIFIVQTPQVFRYDILLEAMKKAEKENFIGTDESILVHRLGNKINIVEGSSLNFKITNTDDIKLFEILSENK